mgnify:CR=1 FL=1
MGLDKQTDEFSLETVIPSSLELGDPGCITVPGVKALKISLPGRLTTWNRRPVNMLPDQEPNDEEDNDRPSAGPGSCHTMPPGDLREPTCDVMTRGSAGVPAPAI